MKKMYFMIPLLILLLTGCTKTIPPKSEDMNPKPPVGTEKSEAIQQPQTDNRPSLGKIHLEDSLSQVEQQLGKEFKETANDEPGHFSEPWYKREYSQGITIIAGKNSGKVLEIDTVSAEFPTNLGAKVGDAAKAVFEQYGAKFKVYTSPQGDGKLEGFYELEDKQIIIFDLNKNDEMLFNKEIKPDSKVEKIRLTRIEHLD